jgi:hypothetical protein
MRWRNPVAGESPESPLLLEPRKEGKAATPRPPLYLPSTEKVALFS